MRRRSLFIQGSEGSSLDSISPANSVAGDYCFYDKTADKVIIVDQTKWSADKYPSDKYTPIGVVVVPGTHNVYGDGSCGVMSLREMSCDTPDEGSTSHTSIGWGHWGTDISELTNYDAVCYIDINADLQNTILGTADAACLPSDRFDITQCPHDTDTYYCYDLGAYYAPSPYLTNGERNPLYYQTTSPSSSENAISDFNGKNNSKVLWNLATGQSDWKTASTIATDTGLGYFPAACCCWRYHTEGTSQGDWYLPACGELGYIMPPFNKINNAITQMCIAYGSSVGLELGTTSEYLSSTEYDGYSARSVDTNNGNIGTSNRLFSDGVRAFLRVKDSTN